MKQQLSGPFRLVIQTIRFQIFLNVAAEEPDFVIFGLCVSLRKRTASLTQTLDFTSNEDDSALDGVKDLVIMPGFSVLANDFYVGLDVLLFFRRLGFRLGRD